MDSKKKMGIFISPFPLPPAFIPAGVFSGLLFAVLECPCFEAEIVPSQLAGFAGIVGCYNKAVFLLWLKINHDCSPVL